MDILNLAHIKAGPVTTHADHLEVAAFGTVSPTVCPACSGALYGHGTKEQVFMDAPIRGYRVKLVLERRRYRCRECGRTLYDPLPEIDAKRNMTERLVAYIEARCMQQTFANLSREVGVDDKTVRNIFDDYVTRLEQSVTYSTPEILGIDEIKIVGSYRATVTNIHANSLFDLRPTRKKVDLIDYFEKLPNKEQIKVVTMDLWSVYRQVVAATLPGRLIVADRFHVVRMANNALEAVRKKIRRGLSQRARLKLKNDRFVLLKRNRGLSEEDKKRLASWVELFPMLGDAYAAKEGFFAIYDQPTRALAEKVAQEWQASVPASVQKEFRVVRLALHNWWNEIFSWYECQVTNAFTESINRLAKDVNRMGRGYSFDVIRAKLLYDQEARKPTTKTVRKHVKKEIPTVGYMDMRMAQEKRYETVIEETVIEYGPHIPTLCRLLEEGHFD